jgi:exodeoxyribonuclease-3
MKIISWNVNGIRAVYKKDFLGWLAETNADIVCLQEIKIQSEQLPPDLVNPKNYYSFFNFANKKGYSGVAVYVRKKPLSIENKLGMERFDTEGRILKLEFPNFLLINVYLPHGGRQKENLDYKLEVYKYLLNCLKKIKNKNVILIGDLNVAHQEIDLARPKGNKNNIMFTSAERNRIDKIIELGFIDTFRKFYKDNGHYTWWPYGFNARERNLGWRIDYAFTSKSLAPKINNAFILNKVTASDHCPIGIEI